MKLIFYSIILSSFVLLSNISYTDSALNNYYIDGGIGNDTNNGLSPEKAWKSLNKLSKSSFKTGDHIFIKGHFVYDGNIVLNSLSGTKNSPITITSYDTTKVIIDAQDSLGLRFINCANLKISNLAIQGNGRLKGNSQNGIEFIQCSGIELNNIEVSGFMFSGVHVSGGHDISLKYIYAHDNGFCGIFAEPGVDKYGPDGSDFKVMKNLYIGYSVAANNPGCPLITDNHSGNGILVAGAQNCTIEYCEAMNNGWDMPREGNGPVGIWAYMSDSVLIQYCYSHHNKTSKNGKDGGGFDFDGGMRNSLMQYNISAYNEGGGYGIFQYAGATEWSHNAIRYNLSFNDGSKNGNCGIFMWCDPQAIPMKNFEATRNLIVSNQKYAINFEPGSYPAFNFKNNYFVLTAPTDRYIGGNFRDAIFDRNYYKSISGKRANKPQPAIIYDRNALEIDPKIDIEALKSEHFSSQTARQIIEKYLPSDEN